MQLTGNLGDIGLGEIFQILAFSGRSGVLRLRDTRTEGSVVFRDGKVIKAGSTRFKGCVGEALVKDGKISSAWLEEARKKQGERGYAEPIGRLLVRSFKVPAESVESAGAALIQDIVQSFFSWKEGYFEFELCEYAETPEVIQCDPLQYTLKSGLNPQSLAIEGLRLSDEAERDGTGTAPSGDAGNKAPEEAGSFSSVGELLDELGVDEDFFEQKGFQAASNTRGLSVLKEMLEELSGPLTINEILLLILRFSSEFINRSVVFVMKEGHIAGFGQFGIELEGEQPDSRVRGIKIPVEGQSILTEAVEKRKIVVRELEKTEWNEYLIDKLGGRRPIEAFAAPVILQGRVVMVLYGDNVPEARKLDGLSVFETFLAQTSIAMERMLLMGGSANASWF
jgi:hypothetical protein